jgi:hypothetical protein
MIQLAWQYGRYGYRKIAERYRRTPNHGLLATHCVAAASLIVDAALCYVMVSGGFTYAAVMASYIV